VALEDLTVLDPQPDEEHDGGIQYVQVFYGVNGAVDAQGPYFVFHWKEISATDYDAILTVFGLDSALSAEVTVYVRDSDMATWVRRNGIAYRPLPGDKVRWNIRPQEAAILVSRLEAAA
jgi:hypothetical protein